MTYLAATLYINKLYQEQQPKIALAQSGGFIDNVLSGIKEYISNKYKPEKPFASIIGFLGPGLLFRLGFPWLALAYEVADALGFDWIGFWDSIKNSVIEIIKASWSAKEKPSQEEMHQKITAATDQALDQNISDKIDEEKLNELAKKSQGVSMPTSTGSNNIFYLIKQAGLLGSAVRSRGILSRIFRKIIPWTITTALVSLGFAVGGGAVRGAVGIKNTPTEDDSSSGQASTARDLISAQKISPSTSPNLFEFNRNDEGSVWLEKGNINDIQNIMSSWIFNAYPQFNNEKEQIINSPSFIEIENMFKSRNKLASGLGIYSVPKPFERKIDIVSYIINRYLNTRPQPQQEPNASKA